MAKVEQLAAWVTQTSLIDHSQIVQLECLRSGLWGTRSLWGRILTYKENSEKRKERP